MGDPWKGFKEAVEKQNPGLVVGEELTSKITVVRYLLPSEKLPPSNGIIYEHPSGRTLAYLVLRDSAPWFNLTWDELEPLIAHRDVRTWQDLENLIVRYVKEGVLCAT